MHVNHALSVFVQLVAGLAFGAAYGYAAYTINVSPFESVDVHHVQQPISCAGSDPACSLRAAYCNPIGGGGGGRGSTTGSCSAGITCKMYGPSCHKVQLWRHTCLLCHVCCCRAPLGILSLGIWQVRGLFPAGATPYRVQAAPHIAAKGSA